MSNSRYRVIGPRGEGPYDVIADSGLQAAARVIEEHGLNGYRPGGSRGGYHLDEPRGPHGAVIGYEQAGNVSVKVGAFDITWLGRAD